MVKCSSCNAEMDHIRTEVVCHIREGYDVILDADVTWRCPSCNSTFIEKINKMVCLK